MRFVPRQPDTSVNVSKTHPLAEASTLLIGLSLLFALIVALLVFLVEIGLYFIPVEKEAKLFENWLPDDLLTVAPHDERLLAAQNLTDRLARHWPDAPYKFRVEIDTSEIPNATALPGGLIVLTKGLLDQVESENELAFVIGHELGHFHNRDHMRALGRVLVLSVALAVSSGGDSSGIGVNVADVALRGFSRHHESRADEFGLMLVQSQYGHVNQAWRLFERWDEGGSGHAADLVSYLSTHPDTGDRIVELQTLAQSRGWPSQGQVTPVRWSSGATR